MRTLPLSASERVTLDGSGGGTAQLGPALPGEVWYPAVVSVSVATAVAEAQCSIYSGAAVGAPTFVDGTYSGSSGDSTDRATQPLHPGMSIWAQWSGGDAGATATVRVTGTKTVP